VETREKKNEPYVLYFFLSFSLEDFRVMIPPMVARGFVQPIKHQLSYVLRDERDRFVIRPA
jgi:hypothetical protein